MPECSCGNDIEQKNSAGHWRESCSECIRDVANSRTPHVTQCDDGQCQVCASKFAELQSVFDLSI